MNKIYFSKRALEDLDSYISDIREIQFEIPSYRDRMDSIRYDYAVMMADELVTEMKQYFNPEPSR